MKGSREDPRNAKTLSTGCRGCGADDLFGGYFDTDGLASDGSRPGDEWLIVCNACGDFHLVG